MCLSQMGKLEESVRFMDDADITLSMDSRQTASQQMTSIEIGSQPIVFRASQRDINLIMSIVTRATQLAAKTPPANSPAVVATTKKDKTTKTRTKASRRYSTEQPRLIMSKEKVRGTAIQSIFTHNRAAQSIYRRDSPCAHRRSTRTAYASFPNQTFRGSSPRLDRGCE